jgi:hypothetical protein
MLNRTGPKPFVIVLERLIPYERVNFASFSSKFAGYSFTVVVYKLVELIVICMVAMVLSTDRRVLGLLHKPLITISWTLKESLVIGR